MKSAIVNIQIQFDLFGKGDIAEVTQFLHNINSTLQEQYSLQQPQLFVGAVRDEDIEISGDEEDGGTMDGHIHPQEPIWSEIRDTFEDEGILHIDAWKTEDEEEDGRTIAKINMQNGTVEYFDERARTDESAQETIQFNVHQIKKGLV